MSKPNRWGIDWTAYRTALAADGTKYIVKALFALFALFFCAKCYPELSTVVHSHLVPQSKIVMSQTNGADKDGADNPSPITQSDTISETDPDVNEKPSEPSDETDKGDTPNTLTKASPLPQEVYATDLEIIDSSLDLAIDEDVSMDGVLYKSSIYHRCVWYCDEKDGLGVVEFDLNKEFRTFTVNVGVLQQTKDPSQIGTFIVYVDGVEKDVRQVAYGKPDFISVDVSGGVRLKLVSSREGEITGPIESGLNATQGDPNVLPDLVWGSPQLHR